MEEQGLVARKDFESNSLIRILSSGSWLKPGGFTGWAFALEQSGVEHGYCRVGSDLSRDGDRASERANLCDESSLSMPTSTFLIQDFGTRSQEISVLLDQHLEFIDLLTDQFPRIVIRR